jgi:hypothetical protein
MLRRIIFAATGAFCCISSTSAKELSLRCIPEHRPESGDGDHTARIELEYEDGRFSIVHVEENGERVDRASQYTIHVKRDGNAPAWEGLNKRRRYLTMIGKIVRSSDNSYEYVEQLFDARDGGAKVYESRAKCQTEAAAPKAAPEPVDPPQKSATPACQAIADAHARLECYDRQYPPAHNGVAEQDPPKPPAPEGKSGAGDLTDADLDAMRSTYEKNQARFVRDFAGRTFLASLQVENVTRSRAVKNRFDLNLERGITCGIDEPQIVSFITNLNKGDKVRVRGVVEDIANGNVELTKCELSPASGSAPQ